MTELDKALELVTQFKAASKEEDRISLAKTVAGAATTPDVKYAMAKDGISKPCIELLKSKSESAQKFGAYLLHCVCYGSDKARSLMGQEGVIPPLIPLLESPHKSVRNQVTLTLGSLVKGSNKNKIAVLKAGGVPPLMDIILKSTDTKLVENVTGVIRNLATNSGIAVEIMKSNPITRLIALLGAGNIAQAESVHVLTNLASHDASRDQLVQGGVVSALIPLLNSTVADVAAAVADAIMFLSQEERLLPKLEEAVVPIVDLWKRSTDAKLKNDATETLRNMAKNEKLRNLINANDAGKALTTNSPTPNSPKIPVSPKIDKLMKQLEDPDVDKSTEAAKVLAELVQKEGNETKEQILRQGLFAFLWKTAKQGRLTWDDKWYSTIDSSKLSFKDELGVGAFAIVYKGTYKNKGKKEEVAIKAMDENLINLPDLRCELATMSMMTGVVENIVDFKGYFYLQQKSKGKIKTVKNYHCIVMELMETNLEEVIHVKKQKLSDATMRWLAYDIAYGMSKIHSFDIIHRDIKPANILLNKIPDAPEGSRQYIVKIADFGYARRDTNDSIRKSVVGTPAYLAPELIGQTKSFDVSRPTDVYSYGVVVWELATGKRPHDGLEVNSLYQSVFDAKKTGRPILSIPEKCEPTLKMILERALLPDPNKRPTFEDCYHALEKTTTISAPVK